MASGMTMDSHAQTSPNPLLGGEVEMDFSSAEEGEKGQKHLCVLALKGSIYKLIIPFSLRKLVSS